MVAIASTELCELDLLRNAIVPIMAWGGQFRVWSVEIGDGPRLVKLPPLLAPSKISYSKISKCISTKVYIFLAILYPAIKYFRLAL